MLMLMAFVMDRMHKQFAALDIWRKEKEEGKEISRPPPK